MKKTDLSGGSVTGALLLFALLISAPALLFCDELLILLAVPVEIRAMMREYVMIIFVGIFFVFLYHYYAFVLRALGNSVVPLVFLGAASVFLL